MAVTLYTIAACPHCRALRDRLLAEGRAFTEIDVASRPELVPELVKLTGRRRIVPVLVDETRVLVAPDGGTAF